MASENIRKFHEILKADAELHDRLEDLGETFVGDHSNERAFLEATVCRLAEEAGLPFSADEAQQFFGEAE